MGAVIIQMLPGDYNEVLNGQQNISQLFNNLIYNKANYQQILTHLQEYHSDEDGAPIVPEFDIADINFNPATHSGQVRFTYQVDFTFACADRRSTTQHTETSNFVIDALSATLSISIHDKISRNPFEEF